MVRMYRYRVIEITIFLKEFRDHVSNYIVLVMDSDIKCSNVVPYHDRLMYRYHSGM